MTEFANLMLITDNNKKHYIVIKSLRRLLSRQNSNTRSLNTFVLISCRDLRKRNLEMNTMYIADTQCNTQMAIPIQGRVHDVHRFRIDTRANPRSE